MSKITDHVEKHKVAYISAGAGVVVGVTATLILTQTGAANTAIQKVVAFKTGDISQHVIQQLARRGHPGVVIKCNETGEVFASINRAAEVMNISRRGLQTHLQGLKDSVGGFTFEMLGEATK